MFQWKNKHYQIRLNTQSYMRVEMNQVTSLWQWDQKIPDDASLDFYDD